jgi:hypothetical protein
MTGPRFCIYARQSITGQDEQGDSLSIQSQIQACHDYAARLATTHAALLDARTALPLLARWTPEELPAQLNALDVRLVIGAGPARLRWNGESAAFFDDSLR